MQEITSISQRSGRLGRKDAFHINSNANQQDTISKLKNMKYYAAIFIVFSTCGCGMCSAMFALITKGHGSAQFL